MSIKPEDALHKANHLFDLAKSRGVTTAEGRELLGQSNGIKEGWRAGWAMGGSAVAARTAADIRREMLVCCDIYDRSLNGEPVDLSGEHAVCFWGGAAARIAERYLNGAAL